MILEDSSKIRRNAQVEWAGLFGSYCSVHGNGYGGRFSFEFIKRNNMITA